MKLLTIFSLALVLAAGSTSVAAKERHRDGHKKHGIQAVHQSSHHYKKSHHKRNNRAHHRSERRHLRHNRNAWRHANRNSWRQSSNRGWRHSNRRDWRYKYDYYPTLFSASILGTVIGHHLYHTHDGAVCYDRHEDQRRDRGRDRDTSYSEVSGCHRVERLPDGGERRVEVPLSECN